MSNTRILPDYYKILDVPVTATVKEIKKKYRELARIHHPDKNRDNPNYIDTKFKDMVKAIEILGNEQNKSKYDADVKLANINTSQFVPKSSNFFHQPRDKSSASKPKTTSSVPPKPETKSPPNNSKFRFNAKAPIFVPAGSSSDPTMTEIKTTFDLAKFSGQIVSFEVPEELLFIREDNYTILGKRFAYVGKGLTTIIDSNGRNRGEVFSFSLLMIPNRNWSSISLGSYNLPGLSLKARSATPEEMDLIKKAGETNHAWFASYNNHLLTDIFKIQMKYSRSPGF